MAGRNLTLTLSSLFDEVLVEGNHSGFGDILSALRNETSHADPLDFGTLVKLVDGVRSRLNWSSAEPGCSYCAAGFRDVVLAYNSVHGYFSLMICFFGSLANALNVAVLTRRDLAAAPINRLLKWLAVADVLVMLEYVPFAVYRYLVLPGRAEMPYAWAAYLLFHMHFAQLLHTASICLTIALAVWRYVAIKYSDRSHVLCTERRCSLAILTSFLLPPLLGVPTFMVFDIHTALVLEPGGPRLLYHVDADRDGRLFHANFWVHAVVVKLLPCALLTAISLWLIKEVYSANQHQKKVLLSNQKAQLARRSKAERRTDRTTRMLVAVLLLFLITELPQGILGLLSGLLGRCFFKRCYDLFGELMDALALLNGAINFVLYCSMSRQFRTTFRQLVLRRRRWPAQTSHSDGQTTGKSSIP